MSSPLLSVCLITYNHEQYIRQAIESILSQQVNFSWEVIIADDYSTDNTRKIIGEYHDKNSGIIKLLFQEKNVGPAKNFTDLIGEAKGKYIAYLEGDDYWIDCNKLQKQVDFLEHHPNYIGCFHNTEERHEDEENASFLYCHYPTARNISFEDLGYANLIPSCSVVFKSNLFGAFPPWYQSLKMGDWTLHLLNAQFGDFWYMPKVMAVHRLHKQSTWMLQDMERNNQFVIDAYDAMITGFSYDNDYVAYLMRAKTAFILSRQAKKNNTTFKNKAKRFIIRMIEKL